MNNTFSLRFLLYLPQNNTFGKEKWHKTTFFSIILMKIWETLLKLLEFTRFTKRCNGPSMCSVYWWQPSMPVLVPGKQLYLPQLTEGKVWLALFVSCRQSLYEIQNYGCSTPKHDGNKLGSHLDPDRSLFLFIWWPSLL